MDRRKGWLRKLRVGDTVRVYWPPHHRVITTVDRITPAGKIDVIVNGSPMRFHWTGWAYGGWFELESLG